jgi:hypothetical protein
MVKLNNEDKPGVVSGFVLTKLLKKKRKLNFIY